MDIWQFARKSLSREDVEQAHALGFDRCQQCDEWFHMAAEGWADCVRCGRHCPTCADELNWNWCDKCGLHTCQNCVEIGESNYCEVCSIEYKDA